jgi:uncharacterized protein (DUF433 family)
MRREEHTVDDRRLLKRIVANPKIMCGKPVIKGTRLAVDYIVNLLAHGETADGILNEYRQLKHEDIQACLLFAAKSLENTEFMPLAVGAH